MRKVLLAIACVATVMGAANAANAAEPLAVQNSQSTTRAEVLADLEMWDRAGMNRYPSEVGYTDVKLNADYQASLSEYHRLRSGPEFQQAVQRLQTKLGNQ
ncbi:DUF4148 domain-containing protein [Lampropedia aestuarii]|uniref:DUF4148 domain-containing protein n=1 Tax=Lampropedia aestuarii TaxID=2562762 RepID=A0A4S5BX06_9BURK|nr:DUF4148 domain-containing protein [Lampropedia aestuarii]MDH5857981.1 DUF4148 domain-containing protein [Lampropedia aestuarii]THJ34568.1 DUF4148 domain-containing protein [Lampropedia aestuarii]